MTVDFSCVIILSATCRQVERQLSAWRSETEMKARCFALYAVIETGGKQYKVQQGDVLFVEKLGLEEGDSVKFDKVLMVGKEDGLVVGAPYVEGAAVEATVVKNGKDRKIIVYKFKAKKNYRRKQGHRRSRGMRGTMRTDGISSAPRSARPPT